MVGQSTAWRNMWAQVRDARAVRCVHLPTFTHRARTQHAERVALLTVLLNPAQAMQGQETRCHHARVG